MLTANGWAMFDAAATWAAGGCSGPPPPPPPAAPDGEVTHVVQVSVDGFNPDAITALGPSGAPNLHALIADGASTLDARTAVEVTRTLPNHTSMFTARTVLGAGGHQVSFNEDDGRTVHAAAGEYVASVFDVVHDAGLRTAFYAGGSQVRLLRPDAGTRRTARRTSPAPTTAATRSTATSGTPGDVTTTALVNQLTSATPAAFSFLHLAATDSAGHSYGFMGPEYLQAVADVDAQIGQIRGAIESDPDLAGHTVLIVTADHGGLGLTHQDETALANYRIPLLAWGSGVTAGADLYALNPDRAHPGTTRPGYGDVPPPLRNGETANLVTDLLGLPPVPGSTLDVDQSLDLAAPVSPAP